MGRVTFVVKYGLFLLGFFLFSEKSAEKFRVFSDYSGDKTDTIGNRLAVASISDNSKWNRDEGKIARGVNYSVRPYGTSAG